MLFWDVGTGILIAAGLLGAAGFLRLPGILAVWLGVAVYAWAGHWAVFSREDVAVSGLLAVVGEVAGHWLGTLGPVWRRRQRDAITGVGSFLVLGVVLGPYLGAGIWELLIGRRLKLNLREALLASARGLAGRLVRLAVGLGLTVFFLGRV